MTMNIEWRQDGKTALVLSGGGARGAYQVGVLKAMADMFPKHSHNPFSIITGTSAGAINAVAIAASANNFRLSVKKVEKIWTDLTVNNIYRADAPHLLGNILRLGASLLHDGFARKRPLALLDNSPLRELLGHTIQFRNIQRRIDAGYLDAVGVTASAYTNGESITFFQGSRNMPAWQVARKVGQPALLSIEHLMASSALPTIFPAQELGGEYYGDGALRQISPISPALHMGADRVVVIGVSGNSNRVTRKPEGHPPSMAKLVGHIFNSAFLDAMDTDLDHLSRINELLGILENENPNAPTSGMRKVDLLCIEPSIAFDELAEQHVGELPRSMRAVLNITGATQRGGGGSMASYLLFEGGFCRDLIRHGYQDAMDQKAIIGQFFGLPVDQAVLP